MSHTLRLTVLLCLVSALFGLSRGASAQQTTTSPLLESGPYQMGVRILQLVDASRENRSLQAFVWYPAQISPDAPRPYPPDDQDAPYPLIIYSHGDPGSPAESVDSIVEHLVSYGFIVASIDHRDRGSTFGLELINRPLDVVFLLNELAALEDDPLADVIDTDHVGVMGLSMGAYTTVAAGGARIDVEHLRDWCSTEGAAVQAAFYCDDGELLSTLDTVQNELGRSSDGSLWDAISDERIRALLPIPPCLSNVFGERGLAALNVPILLMAGTGDEICPYELDAAYAYEHVSSADRYLVSLENYSHNQTVLFTRDLLRHMALAFFGYYLQDNGDYAQYLTPEWAAMLPDATLETHLDED